MVILVFFLGLFSLKYRSMYLLNSAQWQIMGFAVVTMYSLYKYFMKMWTNENQWATKENESGTKYNDFGLEIHCRQYVCLSLCLVRYSLLSEFALF